MTREARHIAAAVATTAFVAAYVASEMFCVPTIWYRPIEHRWALSCGNDIAMGWYGHAIEACAVAVVTFGGTAFALRRARPDRQMAALAVLACAAAFIVAVFVEVLRST